MKWTTARVVLEDPGCSNGIHSIAKEMRCFYCKRKFAVVVE